MSAPRSSEGGGRVLEMKRNFWTIMVAIRTRVSSKTLTCVDTRSTCHMGDGACGTSADDREEKARARREHVFCTCQEKSARGELSLRCTPRDAR